ncbi:MAG TPA: hypothetical protein VH639_01820 [Bryobacteraceae bacterium]|jgi:hypothetical protein
MGYLSGLLNKRIDSSHLRSTLESMRGPAPLPQVNIRFPEVNRRPVSLLGVLSEAAAGAGVAAAIHTMPVAPVRPPKVDCRIPKIQLKQPPGRY